MLQGLHLLSTISMSCGDLKAYYMLQATGSLTFIPKDINRVT